MKTTIPRVERAAAISLSIMAGAALSHLVAS